jgi:two-component system copper resistance phosphate regulon response regulator CusR
MRILIVEDEPKVASFLKQGLEEENYEVEVAFDGQMGKRLALKNNFDIILMDVIMPYTNGLQLCKELRDENIQTPVLMLTALGTTDDKISGFDAGADDYLVKPFEFKELLARIRALTKRQVGAAQKSNKLTYRELTLDLDKKIAIREGKNISLTAKEFGLLEYMMRNVGKLLSRIDISEKVWDINFDTGTNTVDVYINILRKKIDKDFKETYIQTRIGHGYIFQIKDE